MHAVAPALTRLDTDFPDYLTAARIVADRGEVDRLYDNAWFQDQMRRYHIGKPSEGKFAPFPPPTALLWVSLARLTPLDALRVVTGLSVLALAVSVTLLSRILGWSVLDSALLVLLSGVAAINAVRLGQPYMLVSLSCILGYYAYLRGRPLLAGLCFGLFTPIKYFPVVILIYFAFCKQWRVVLGGAAAILAVVLVSIGLLGWKVHQEFLSSVLGMHLVGQLSMQDPFTASFQSFDTLFRRLFVFDATSNPHPMLSSPELSGPAVAITKSLIFCTAIATLIRLARSAGERAPPASIGLLGILVLLLAPATATYHFVLLWLPIGLLINFLLREGARAFAYFILGVYALIGFFPYRLSVHFEGDGALTLLAYPRLFLLLAMFMACVIFVWRPRRGMA
ncbi:MAG TPA: glycosyltransferase family 87 protein [Steroidobacteraceae bacterium]|nr:glycosyltransferase family 87 protein [Steroidobacteraceae bacterium]